MLKHGFWHKSKEKILKFQKILGHFILCGDKHQGANFNNSLHKISCPTLLLYGKKNTANKNASIELAELLKNVELKTIIGAGHEVNIESPQELAEILHAFYERMS